LLLLCRADRPWAVLLLPMVLEKSANAPSAVFPMPVLLNKSAPAPVAVFSSAVFRASAPAPMPVLKLAVLALLSDSQPTAVLYVPVVRPKRAVCPSAVFPPGYPPSGGGTTAGAIEQSAMLPSVRSILVMYRFVIIFSFASSFVQKIYQLVE